MTNVLLICHFQCMTILVRDKLNDKLSQCDKLNDGYNSSSNLSLWLNLSFDLSRNIGRKPQFLFRKTRFFGEKLGFSIEKPGFLIYWTLTAHNCQKWKRVFLTCPCHKIYRGEAVGLKSSKYTWKIMIYVNMWNLEQFRENLIFCQ